MLEEQEEQRIVRAIANAERDNRGEVRVHIEERCPGDALTRARAVYRLLGLDRTRDDTAVLLYVASRSRVAAVYCGAGVHDPADTDFWSGVSDRVARGFAAGDPAGGLCDALGQIGELLRERVGGPDEAGDELSNAVTVGADVSAAPKPGEPA